MQLLEELVSIGFKLEEAQKLAESDFFHHRKKSGEELTDLFTKISSTYNCSIEKVKKAVLSFPQFAGLDHQRVVKEGIEVYGVENEDKVKKAVLGFPPFAGLDHQRVVREATRTYFTLDSKKNLHENVAEMRRIKSKVKKAVLTHPQFAGLDHQRVVKEGIEVYGVENEDKVKKAVLGFPPFAGLDHQRVVREATRTYFTLDSKKNLHENVAEMRRIKSKVKKAVLSFPPFAGYDHQRVVRQKTRLGRLAGLSNEQTINYILNLPVLSSYSAKRYIAGLDIGRQLEKEGFSQDEEMLNAFISYNFKSPYVPETKRLRISQVERRHIKYKEPPMLTAMRKRFIYQRKVA